jgi:hypothetical protein
MLRRVRRKIVHDDCHDLRLVRLQQQIWAVNPGARLAAHRTLTRDPPA